LLVFGGLNAALPRDSKEAEREVLRLLELEVKGDE
jgi:hypothetical protein